jgi:hypothetical protein
MPIHNKQSTALSIPRGGAVLLNPSIAVKLNTAVYFLNGLQYWLSPSTTITSIARKTAPTPTAVWMARRYGCFLASWGVLGICLFYYKTTVYTGLGYVGFLWMLELIKTMLSEEPSKLGLAWASTLIPLAIAAGNVIAALGDYACADQSGTWMVVAFLFVGPLGIVATDFVMKSIFGFEKYRYDAQTSILLKQLGASATGLAIVAKALIEGWLEPRVAFAIGTLVASVVVQLYLSASVEGRAARVNSYSMLGWAMMNVYLSASVILQDM